MTLKKPQASSEIVRPNFGQHTPAIEELLKRKRSFLRTYAVERGDGMRCPP